MNTDRKPRHAGPTIWLTLALLASAYTSQAHTLSTSYLRIARDSTQAATRIEWDIALKDLHEAIGLDLDGDLRVRWSEVERSAPRIEQYAKARLRLSQGDAPCRFAPAQLLYDQHGDGGYAVLQFAADCGASKAPLSVNYGLLFDLDPTHRGLLRVSLDGITESAVLSPGTPRWSASAAGHPGFAILGNFFAQGVWHIWTGYDHLAFLLLLLLPTVLVGGTRTTARCALLSVLQVVTAFTMAHSITLALAVMRIVVPPEKPIEVAIALSVVIAGLINLAPRGQVHGSAIAFLFGLLHGFGFANALRTLDLRGSAIAWPLAGFNLGVEAGQLAVVALVLPLLYGLAHRHNYTRRWVPGASLAVASLATVWIVQRW